MKRAYKVCVPMVLFGIFILAGLIGLLCEQLHNDLFTGTGAFLTSFTALSGVAYKIYGMLMG